MTTNTAAKTVLVVDDDEIMRDVTHEMLHHAGVPNIHLVPNGQQALRLLDTLPDTPDLLICDLYMPDMDGFEFLQELAKIKYSGRLLLVSGASAEILSLAHDIAQATGLRLVGALPKPLNLDHLTTLLKSGV